MPRSRQSGRILGRAMAKNPDERYQTGEEFAASAAQSTCRRFSRHARRGVRYTIRMDHTQPLR